MNRRELLIAAVVAGEGGAALVGCGGGGAGDQSRPEPELEVEPVWSVSPPTLRIGDLALVYDLSPTLPSSVRKGGRFAVDPRGASLPVGVVLSADGVLSLTASAAAGVVDGIVFAYDEPAP